MREGWEIRQLEELCETFADGDWIEKKDQSNSGIRLIQTGNVGNGVFRGKDDSKRYISAATFDRLHCTEIFPGDILVSRLPDPIGRGCLVPETGEKMITAVDCTIIRLKPSCNAKYLVYYTQSGEYQYSVGKVSTGTTRQRISRKNLGEIYIPLPSLPEQQRIVDILDREFAGIDALKANAEKSLQAAKDLFQTTLKKELEPKDGWMTQTIGDVCFVQGGSTPRRTEKAFWENGTYPWFTIDDVREQGRIISDTKQKITKLAWDKIRVFPANSVLLCCTASVGEYALSTIPISSNQQFNGLTIKDEKTLLPMFLFHFASTLKDKLLSLSGKATIDFVSGGKVRSVPISFPASIKEQETIISRLDNINNKCTTLQENYQKTLTLCDDLKQSLLRRAFNGEL